MIFADDTGRRVALAKPPRRIVSLSPSVTENLFAIGAGGLVVGVTTADDYPVEVARLPRIGDFYRPLAERIRALQPDLVIVDSATLHRADMDNLAARLQAPLYAQSSRRYADVGRFQLRLGAITGHDRPARAAAALMAAIASQVARRIHGLPPVRTFVQIDASALYAAGPGSFIDDLIRLAGGVNVVRGANQYPLVSRETLIAADPAVWIVTVPFTPGGPQPPRPPIDPALRDLTAVKTRRIYTLDANQLSRPGPRLADGLAMLARLLHP